MDRPCATRTQQDTLATSIQYYLLRTGGCVSPALARPGRVNYWDSPLANGEYARGNSSVKCILCRDDTTVIGDGAVDCVMVAKTIALDAEAYELLARSKRPGETFSEVVRRTLRPPSEILDLAGSLSDTPAEVWEQVTRERRAHRRRDENRRARLESGVRG